MLMRTAKPNMCQQSVEHATYTIVHIICIVSKVSPLVSVVFPLLRFDHLSQCVFYLCTGFFVAKPQSLFATLRATEVCLPIIIFSVLYLKQYLD